MEIPIQVAVRIYPHRELKDSKECFAPADLKKDAEAEDEGADSKDTAAEVAGVEKDAPERTDSNGNAEEDSATDPKPTADANGNESEAKDSTESAYCVCALPRI